MIIDIQRHLNQFNLDIRKSGEARFIDQKCTPDVVCFISDCLMNLEPQGEFTVQDDAWMAASRSISCMVRFYK